MNVQCQVNQGGISFKVVGVFLSARKSLLLGMLLFSSGLLSSSFQTSFHDSGVGVFFFFFCCFGVFLYTSRMLKGTLHFFNDISLITYIYIYKNQFP